MQMIRQYNSRIAPDKTKIKDLPFSIKESKRI